MVREHDWRLFRKWRDRDEARLNFHPDYDLVDPAVYDRRARAFGGLVVARKISTILEERLPLPVDSVSTAPKILDVAAGGGIIARYLQSKGFRVTGTDMSQRALDYLQAQDPTVEVKKGDMNGKLPFEPNSFDGMVTFWANRFMRSRKVIRNAQRLLREGGVFVWPIDPNERLSWKMQTSFFEPGKASTLTRRLRRRGFDVDTITLTKEELREFRFPIRTVNTFLVATKRTGSKK